MSEKLKIEFTHCLECDKLETLDFCLLIIGDLSEGVQKKKFVNMPTTGRQKNNATLSNNKLFSSEQVVARFDLNVPHIVLFETLRDIQQIIVFKDSKKERNLQDIFTKRQSVHELPKPSMSLIHEVLIFFAFGRSKLITHQQILILLPQSVVKKCHRSKNVTDLPILNS